MNTQALRDWVRLFLGIILYSFGIVMTIVPALGLSPWDSFHQGFSTVFGVTFGQASILIGLIVLVITFFMGEPIGFGTLVNVVGIGWGIDLLFRTEAIPPMPNFFLRVAMLMFGLIIICVATWLYIGAGMGAGPRDGLMLTLVRITPLRLSVIRTLIEVSVAVLGFLMGGQLGLGTVLIFSTIGFLMDWWFQLVGFDPNDVAHRTFSVDDVKKALRSRA